MPKRLTDMKISEISLVDDPANADAQIVIAKSKATPNPDPELWALAGAVLAAIEGLTPEIVSTAVEKANIPADHPTAAAAAKDMITEIVMDLDQLTKALEEANSKIETLEKSAKDATDAKEAAEAKLAKAKAGAPGDEPTGPTEDEILKSLPEPIRKRIEDAEAQAADAIAKANKIAADAERAEYVAKAKTLGVGDPEKVADLMIRVAKGQTTADDLATVTGILQQSAAIEATSDLFKSLGTPQPKAAGPEEQLIAKAKELQAAEPGTSYEVAYEKALTQNPGLYDEFRKQKAAR